MGIIDLITGKDRKRAEEEHRQLEIARQKSLQRATQSPNPVVAQKAQTKVQNNAWRVQAPPQPTLKQNFEDATGTVGKTLFNFGKGVVEAPVALGRGVGNTLATFSVDYRRAQESEQMLRDIENQTNGTMFKLLKNGTPEQQQRAANYLNKSQPAKTGMNDLRTQIASENDPKRLAAAGASLALDLATLGVAGASKQGIKTAYQGAKAAQVANNANKARQVTSGVIAGTKRYGIDTAKTAAMGGASGGLSAYINDPNATAKQALSGVGMGAAMGGALPTAFIGASYAPTVVKSVQNADLGAKALQAGRVLRDLGKPTGQALQNLQTAKANVDTQITGLLQKRSIAQTRKPDLVPILDRQIDDLYTQSDSLTRKMNTRGQGGYANADPTKPTIKNMFGEEVPNPAYKGAPIEKTPKKTMPTIDELNAKLAKEGKPEYRGKTVSSISKGKDGTMNVKFTDGTKIDGAPVPIEFAPDMEIAKGVTVKNIQDVGEELSNAMFKLFDETGDKFNNRDGDSLMWRMGWAQYTAADIARSGKKPTAKLVIDKMLQDGQLKRETYDELLPRIGNKSTPVSAPIEKTAPKLAPKPIRTVFDTDKIYQSSSKAKKEVVDAAVGEEVMNRKEKYAMWKQLHNEIKSLGGINSKADELQGGYRKTSGVVFKKDGSQRLDEIAQELSSTGQYGTLTPEELLDLYENKPTIGRLADIKNKVINDLENGTHPYSDDYKAIQQDLGKRELELQDVPVTAKMVDKPDTKMTDAEWQSLQETAPMEAKSTRQAIGGELASVRKELEASKKLATQLQERQKMEVIQGKQNVASKMRDSNAKIYEDIKRLEKRERELAKQYAMESPVDNRVNMSDPKNVNLDGIEERLTSTLKDKGKKQTFKDLSREYLGSVEAAKIDADKRAMDFTKKFNLTDEEKLSVINATDNPTIKTSGKVKQAVEDLHKTYDELYAYFTKEKGVDMGYQHDYYPREYVNTKTGDQMTAAEYDLLQRASKRTKGRTSDALADWKLKYTDPAEGLKSYYQNLEKAAAGRKYMQDLEKQGLVVWGDGAPMQGYRPIIAEGLQPSKGGVYYAKKEVADKLDTMFGSKEATNIVEKALEKGEGLNSFWQSVVLSGGVPNTPINAFGFMQVMKEGMALHPIKAAKAMWGGVNKGFSQKYFEAKAPVMTLMAKEGIPIRYSISEGAKKGLGRTKAAFDESKARGINQAWNELTNDATFGRFMPLLEVQHFENIYKHGLKKGLTPEKAAKIAGDSTKNFYGITDLYSKTTRPGIVDKASGTFLFAPRFRESMLNFWVKNAKALGVSDGKWNALKPEYRDNAKFMAAAALTYAGYDILNHELNGTHLWENPDGKKDKLLIPNATSDGKTIGVPFLPSIGTVPRNAGMGLYNLATGNFGEAGKNATSFLSMPVRTAGELLTNENYFGAPIVKKDASAPERLTQGVSHVAKSTLQPWLREGLNVAGQGLPDGVKDALGIKKKGALETASNALEAPLRFYDPKYMKGAGDNFKTPTGTVGSDKAAKGTKLTIDQAKDIQKKEYGGKYANLNQDELKELAKTDPEAAKYKKSYDATVAAYGKTPDLPDGLNESARKILERSSRLTSEGKDKWNKRETTEKAVTDNIKSWLPDKTRPPKITNETAKQWAEYERDRLDGKINDIEANTKKRTILTNAYKSELDDVTQSFYKLGDDAMRSELEKGTISREQMNKVIEIDNILTSMGIQKYSQVGKKLRAELGYGAVSGKSSSGSSKSSKSRSSKGGSSSPKFTIPDGFSLLPYSGSSISSIVNLLHNAKVQGPPMRKRT